MAENDEKQTAVTDATEAAAGDARRAIDEAREKFGRVAEEVKDRFEKVSGDVQSRARRAGAEARKGAEAARARYAETSDTVRAGYERAQERATEVSGTVADFVQRKPGQAVLLAAGVGFLLGLLIRGRD